LTIANIKKYYPYNDPLKPTSQLSKKAVSKFQEKHYNLSYCGEQVEIDVLLVSTPTSSIPKATNGYRHVVLVVDAYSSFLSCVPIKNMSRPHRFVETIVQSYQTAGHPIKHIKMDNQFNTSDVLSYLDSMHITYQFAPPYEHEFIGRIERNNRTPQDKLSCALSISSTKNKKLWLFALTDAIAKLNVMSSQPLKWQSPYYLWYQQQIFKINKINKINK
jgi:hypothetical protein